jgi:glycosyltransferase involved in cell wall biosynthesis
VFLPELYPSVPIINYFDFYYHSHHSDMDFRPDFLPSELECLRARARNAMLLLDLETCRRGYSPTHFQRQLFPASYQPKIDVIFDGIETEVFRRQQGVSRQIAGRSIPESTRIVTYVSRGFESMRGFDIFMKVARQVYQHFPDVVFVVVGSDRVCYGGDERHIRHQSFLKHVLAQSEFDMSKFIFSGLLPVAELVRVLSLSDLHIYLTVPFVLSWSLMNALACGCTVLASDTEPVREMIEDGHHGLLCGFFDSDGFADRAVEVLRDPPAFRPLGCAAVERIRRDYAIDVTLPRLARLFEQTVGGAR